MKKAIVVFTVVAACSTVFSLQNASAANPIGGTNNAETIVGTQGRDIIFGKGGNDVIRGLSGDDLIFGGSGADKLDGGPGDDVIVDDDGTSGDVLLGRDGSDILYSLDGGNDTLNCGAGGGVAFADPGDTVHGCNRIIRSSQNYRGFHVRVAGNGNSFLDKAKNAVYDFGRKGNDILRGSDDGDLIFGGGGNDIMQGYKGDDSFVDDDGAGNEAIQTGGQDGDVVYMADGAKSSVDCTDSDGDNSGAIVFADNVDSVFHCNRVVRV